MVMFAVKQLLPLATWVYACLLLVQAARPRDDADDELQPEGDMASELEAECTASVNGLWARLQRGLRPDHLSLPEKCKPNGEIPIRDGLPNVKGSFKAVCYTERKAKALGVDMQGCLLGSDCAIKLSTALEDRTDVPTCEPKHPVKLDTSETHPPVPAAAAHDAPEEHIVQIAVAHGVSEEHPEKHAEEEDKAVSPAVAHDAHQEHPEKPPEEEDKAVPHIVPPVPHAPETPEAAPSSTTPTAPDTQGTKPVADAEETYASNMSSDEFTETINEDIGEEKMAEVPDPNAKDIPAEQKAISRPVKIRQPDASAFDEDQDGSLDFYELVTYKHEISVIKTMKTLQMTLDENNMSILDLESCVKVQAFTFTFEDQELLHVRMVAEDKDTDGKLSPEELRHLEQQEHDREEDDA